MMLFRSSGGQFKSVAMKLCDALIQREDEISFVNEYISADDFEKYGLHDIGRMFIEGAGLVDDGLRCIARLHDVFLDRLRLQRARHTLLIGRL